MKPYVCPVCSGRGFMSKTFYNSYFTQSTAIESNHATCKSCNGLGYILTNNCNKKHCECSKKNGAITICDYPSTNASTISNIDIPITFSTTTTSLSE